MAWFGTFQVKLRSAEFYKNGLRIKLQEQPFQILAMLLERPGEVVTREELRQKLWPVDTFVDFEQSLNTGIMRLRHALNDSADNPLFIETLPRHGYRFIAPVELVSATLEAGGQIGCSAGQAASAASDPPSQGQNLLQAAKRMAVAHGPGRRVLISAMGIVVIIALLVTFNVGGWRDQLTGHAPPQVQSLAVLPFDSLSRDPEQEYFAESMTEELITELGKLSWLRVVSRSSVMQYSGKHRPLEEVARQLQVDAVMEGSVARSGDKVRVTANLFEVSTHRHLLAETYERDLRDVLSVQKEVARDIADKIQTKLKSREPALGQRPQGGP